jgi:hypothetical protein
VKLPRPSIAALGLLLLAAPANAGTVAIVQPPSPTADLTETVSRLHGELISVGLEVRMIAAPEERSANRTDSRLWMEKIAASGGIDAVIDIVGDDAPIWVDVWVIEKSPRRLERWRVESDPNTANASERLAIRTIEVLRSSFLESDMSGKERRPAPIAKSTVKPPPRVELNEVTRHPERIGIGLGATVLMSTDGFGPAILPVLHADGIVRPWLLVHAELAGFGSSPTVASAAGTARVAEQYGIIGSAYRFWADSDFSPVVALSAGALRTSVQGFANAPMQGHSTTQWSFLLDASAGAQWHVLGPFYVSGTGHVQLAEPYVTVHIADAVVATSGRPNLALALMLGAWL